MKAMVLAAGYGTRLKPYTNTCPKALIKCKGIPLIEIVIKKLIKFNFREIIINLHHFPDKIIDFLESKKKFGIKIDYSHEEKLLDTGGGIFNASWFFGQNPFLVYNVDIICNINLTDLMNAHLQSDAIATLAVKKREASRYLMFDKSQYLCGWKNNQSREIKFARKSGNTLHPMGFSGIHVISPKIFDILDKQGIFSITSAYLELAQQYKISPYIDNDSFWYDLGKKEIYEQIEQSEFDPCTLY